MIATHLRRAVTDADIASCFVVLQQLRPHLAGAADLLARVRRQEAEGYQLLIASHGECIVGAAGYRIQENLIRGRFAYVDDLVVLKGSSAMGLAHACWMKSRGGQRKPDAAGSCWIPASTMRSVSGSISAGDCSRQRCISGKASCEGLRCRSYGFAISPRLDGVNGLVVRRGTACVSLGPARAKRTGAVRME